MSYWEILIIGVIGVLSLLVLLVVLLLLKRINAMTSKPETDTGLLAMQQQVDALRQQIQSSMDNNGRLIQEQTGQVMNSLQQTQNNVRSEVNQVQQMHQNLQHKLGQLEESNKKIFELGKDLAGLEQILKVPKLRGGLGEYFLEGLLRQILPPHCFELQYTFKNNEKVDAVIYLGGKMVPVDSKFPLESFRRMMAADSDELRESERKTFDRDVKKHIDAIANKYIRPAENTFDFALMYIPAENVYYETVLQQYQNDDKKNLMAYALENKVIPVSPNSFYAYLQTILLGLRGFQIEKHAQKVIDDLANLQKDFIKFNDDFNRMGKHLSNLSKAYTDCDQHKDRFSDRLETITGIHDTPELEDSVLKIPDDNQPEDKGL